MNSKCNEIEFSLLLGMFKDLFPTRKQTDYVYHLILARIEKVEVIPDNTSLKSYLPLFVTNCKWIFVPLWINRYPH